MDTTLARKIISYTSMTPTGCRPYGQTTYTKAVGRIQGKVGPSGLMNVAGSRDWPQLGGAGAGIDAEGNTQYQEVRSIERPVLRKWLT